MKIENGSYHGVPADFATASIRYSNMVWWLPDIHVVRPEGELDLTMRADDRTFTFEWNVQGVVDPNLVRPYLNDEQEEWLNEVNWNNAPVIEARILGEWGEIESLGVQGHVAMENVRVKGIEFDSIRSGIDYTNKVIRFQNVVVRQEERGVEADRIVLDLNTNRVHFLNVASTINPMDVAHIIGEEVIEVLSPYKFAKPPHILLNGSLGLTSIKTADMHFDIAGKDFRWGYLRADAGSARADWVNETLTLTNITAIGYGGGNMAGNAFIDFTPKGKADYRLNATFTNADVAALVRSLDATNRLEGLLSGFLEVSSADTSGLHTWNGRGAAELKDGMLWELGIFGLFTPILDAIYPGLGKSRARSAVGTFNITNGVAFSDDLEIRSSGFRMQYRGTINHEQQVAARVLAEPLRDTWAVGRVLSAALMPLSKLFEYKISGTLEDPVMEPLYVPKVVMMTLRPIKTLKKFLLPDREDVEADTVPVEQP